MSLSFAPFCAFLHVFVQLFKSQSFVCNFSQLCYQPLPAQPGVTVAIISSSGDEVRVVRITPSTIMKQDGGWFVMPVLGHVLKHVPEYALKHVLRHMLDKHVLEHVLNRMAHAVLMT